MRHSNFHRYARIIAWAQSRYTINHSLIVSVGGVPSLYSRIENAAFDKYMRLPRDQSGSIIFG